MRSRLVNTTFRCNTRRDRLGVARKMTREVHGVVQDPNNVNDAWLGHAIEDEMATAVAFSSYV